MYIKGLGKDHFQAPILGTQRHNLRRLLHLPERREYYFLPIAYSSTHVAGSSIYHLFIFLSGSAK